jgi:thiol-disulfide isomerase/thioredoxin
VKNILRHAVVLAAALAWTSACTPSAAPGAAEGAAALSGKTLDGKTASLAGYKGKVVLVDFWATWCGPCQEEIPELVALQKKLGPKGFVILGVSMDEETADVAPFAKAKHIDYPVILNGSERAPAGWVVPGLPTAYLIGRDGMVIERLFGSKSVEKLSVEVETALAKK